MSVDSDFGFRSIQSLSSVDDLCAWFKDQSLKPSSSFIYEKDKDTNILSLAISKEDSWLMVKIKDVGGKVLYKKVEEMSSFGGWESSKHYKLEVAGMDIEGVKFVFRASISYESEGGPWSRSARIYLEKG